MRQQVQKELMHKYIRQYWRKYLVFNQKTLNLMKYLFYHWFLLFSFIALSQSLGPYQLP